MHRRLRTHLVAPLLSVLALASIALVGCAPRDAAEPSGETGEPPALADAGAPRAERVQRLLETLAADSMEGREAGTPGEERAVRVLESELARYGVQPGGTDGYRQPVRLALRTVEGQGGRGRRDRWVRVPEGVPADTIPPERLRTAYNVLGVIPGSDPALAPEIVVVGAHHDHVGIGPAVEGDSIYNGADDDASGTVAVLEIARELAQARLRGEGPGRTILAAFFTAEEMGLQGTVHWIEHPTLPLERVVADLQVEMIARPDTAAGGPGRGWLTGYERSTMGDLLAEQGSPIVPDPRPEMRFFFRSDNLPFAARGIPAHTLSSYDLHADYHQPSDEAHLADYGHMAAVIDAAVAMVEALADGPTPQWKEGGREGLESGS